MRQTTPTTTIASEQAETFTDALTSYGALAPLAWEDACGASGIERDAVLSDIFGEKYLLGREWVVEENRDLNYWVALPVTAIVSDEQDGDRTVVEYARDKRMDLDVVLDGGDADQPQAAAVATTTRRYWELCPRGFVNELTVYITETDEEHAAMERYRAEYNARHSEPGDRGALTRITRKHARYLHTEYRAFASSWQATQHRGASESFEACAEEAVAATRALLAEGGTLA